MRRMRLSPRRLDWSHRPGFLGRIEADELCARLMGLRWTDTGLHYGRSYGRVNSLAKVRVEKTQIKKDNEIAEIPTFLTATANRVAAHTRVPINYIQIHRYDSEHPVNPHYDPSGMTVPMITVGHERTFRVGGTMPDKYQRMPQPQRSVEVHAPEQEILLCHGDLIIFNGGRTLHSMLPASQDSQFNRNGYDWRFSVLFRWTTPAMQQYGVGACNDHGQDDQYAAAIKDFQLRQQLKLF